MKKQTKAISLVLLGAALLISGCSSDEEDEEQQGGTGARRHSGAWIGGISRPRGGVVAPSGTSVRGGFGATAGFGAGA